MLKIGLPKNEKTVENKMVLKNTKSTHIQFNLCATREVMDKLRDIAFWERLKLQDIVTLAIRSYIKSYEKKYGPININPDFDNELLSI